MTKITDYFRVVASRQALRDFVQLHPLPWRLENNLVRDAKGVLLCSLGDANGFEMAVLVTLLEEGAKTHRSNIWMGEETHENGF